MEAYLCPLSMNYFSAEYVDSELQNDDLDQHFWNQYSEEYRAFINEYLHENFWK